MELEASSIRAPPASVSSSFPVNLIISSTAISRASSMMIFLRWSLSFGSIPGTIFVTRRRCQPSGDFIGSLTASMASENAESATAWSGISRLLRVPSEMGALPVAPLTASAKDFPPLISCNSFFAFASSGSKVCSTVLRSGTSRLGRRSSNSALIRLSEGDWPLAMASGSR